MSELWQDVTAFPVVVAAIKVVLAFLALLLVTLLVIWAERKVLADMQARIGPNRWGPFGLLQTLADGIKLFFKEDFRPAKADRWTFALAPLFAMVPSFLAFAVIPIGDTVTSGDRKVGLIVSDLNIGILYFLAMGSLGVYGVVLAGWASGSKYPLLGAIRSSAQMISYEIALGLSLVPIALAAGTLSTVEIVEIQAAARSDVTFFDGVPLLEGIANVFEFVPNWYILSQWPAFLIFLVAGIAETNRAPFDLPEAETELVAGFHTEYSGIRFAMFFLGEYIHVVVISAMAVTLFFGGWDGPIFGFLPWVWPLLWFTIKTALFIYLFVWLRGSLPRLRYDRLMWLGWKRLIPAALVWIMVTAVFNTAELDRQVRMGVFAAVMVLVLVWVGRGDPRLKSLAASRARSVTRGKAVTRGSA
ncbi:MAG TPA: NADH-quinone oxidoreductase subunit NuoH [Actinomycetota bacterium]|nr:NADH-quinone oxidoreductase subunit NuoH [Actinomycetota bacterium]